MQYQRWMSQSKMNFHLLRKHLGNSNASCAVICIHPLNVETCMSTHVLTSQIILLSLHLTAYVTGLEHMHLHLNSTVDKST